jgi:general secretion pathway protein I
MRLPAVELDGRQRHAALRRYRTPEQAPLPALPANCCRATAGFTLIEVLVALTVVAVTLSAIGSLVAVTIRGARSVGGHLALVESTRGIMTGLPNRENLTFGNFSGEAGGHRWRVDVLPFNADFVDPDKSIWIPQTVVVRVQSPAGTILQLNTVRLRRKQIQ